MNNFVGHGLLEPYDCPICHRPAEWNVSRDGKLVRCPEVSCRMHADFSNAGFFYQYWQMMAAKAHERKLLMLKLISTLENWAEVCEVSRQTGLAAAHLAKNYFNNK